MPPLTFRLDQLNATHLIQVGGKAANLGELVQAGFNVPLGFCVSTEAFALFIAQETGAIYDQLDQVTGDDVEQARQVGQAVRAHLESLPLPEAVSDAVLTTWRETGVEHAYAVRSSATAEDLPRASFAGQQDTYLNIRGERALLDRVKACFISLFTDRAILYRVKNRFDHRKVALAVVVQQMVEPEVSGILFTADPVSGNRHLIAIDASFGLGEALVGGLVSADLYQVDKRSHRIVRREIASKQIAIQPLLEGGTEQIQLEPERGNTPALGDNQILELAAIGEKIEAHYGSPQDIEWAIVGGELYIIQSRPITSLYPLPEPKPSDSALHVYASISHFQVMTEPIPLLGYSTWLTLVPFGRKPGAIETVLIYYAGGRLYVDFSPVLRHPIGRRMLLRGWKNFDPLAANALAEVAKRPALQSKGESANPLRLLPALVPYLPQVRQILTSGNYEGFAFQTVGLMDRRMDETRARLAEQTTIPDKFEAAIREMHTIFDTIFTWIPHAAIGLISLGVLKRVMKNSADPADLKAIERGLSGNVVTEMTLSIGDLGDAARVSPALLGHLQDDAQSAQERLDQAKAFEGGRAFLDQWHAFVRAYGSRGPSEFKISSPRWSEDPTSLLQMVLNTAQASEPGEHRARYNRLIEEGEAAAAKLLSIADRGMLGRIRGPIVRRLIHLARNLAPMREHHKFMVIRLIEAIKPIYIEAGEHLYSAGQLEHPEDIWHLRIPEIKALLGNPNHAMKDLVAERRKAFAHFHELIPPHVITSDGEVPAVHADSGDVPEGAFAGSAVSAGVVEGPAKIILDPSAETLEPGEILVAPFTDPGWTPLFVNAAGLVTEVGGMMTHGSVVAREYGIPAVVGVLNVTQRIRTGQRVRVHGDGGYVEVLPDHQG